MAVYCTGATIPVRAGTLRLSAQSAAFIPEKDAQDSAQPSGSQLLTREGQEGTQVGGA